MNRLKILVLMGGRSPEYEISIISGSEVVKNLLSKYIAIPVVISRDGKKWNRLSIGDLLSLPNPISLYGTKKEIIKKADNTDVVTSENLSSKFDIVFIAMHGPFGEDGTIQGMLELAGIKYTGSGVLASALGMDKAMFRKLMEKENIPIPKWISLRKGQKIPQLGKLIGPPPYFVKPSSQGSSVGSSIARTNNEIKKALKLAFKYGEIVLIDDYIKGVELTCSLLGNENPKALPLIEIVPLKGEFFDYESKYTESGAEEIIPARISKKLTKKIQKLAIQVHNIIGCRGFSRVDFILKREKPFVLEINTIPGLTPMSLLPKAAKAAGIKYTKLIDTIIKYARN